MLNLTTTLKNWIGNLACEVETAVCCLSTQEQGFMKYKVAQNIKNLHTQHNTIIITKISLNKKNNYKIDDRKTAAASATTTTTTKNNNKGLRSGEGIFRHPLQWHTIEYTACLCPGPSVCDKESHVREVALLIKITRRM